VSAIHKQFTVPQKTWHRAFIGTVADITVAEKWLGSIAADQKLPEQLAFSLQLCLEELMSNIVRHGGAAGRKSGSDLSPEVTTSLSVEITVTVEDQSVSMTVEDDGKPFDVVNAPAHPIDRPLDEVEPGGLGIQLIKSFASGLVYEQAGLGNRVTVELSR
jgi:serine/threonine-protein kinase RsbW